jgi:K+-sensing histidine kinase KdpD
VVLFSLAIAIAAWTGGLGPGLLATALSIVISIWAFVQPIYSFAIADHTKLTSLSILAVIGITTSLLAESLHRKLRKAQGPSPKAPEPTEVPAEKPKEATPDRPPQDVHALINEVLTSIRADAEAKRLRLTVDLEAKNRLAPADAPKLKKVFTNVLGNAVKFTPEDGAIFVQSRNSGDRLVVEIGDTGLGLTTEEIDRLDLGQSSPRSVTSGGLADAKEIISQHHGRMSVASAGRNRGAIFTIDLPAAR